VLTSHHSQRKCGTSITDAQVKAAEAHFKANKVTPSEVSLAATVVNVYFHVVAAGTTLAQGNVPCVIRHTSLERYIDHAPLNRRQTQVQAQIDVLNADYASTGISFVLANTTRTTNSGWFNNAGPSNSQQTAMKNALRVGGAADLNVYSVGYVSVSVSVISY
jgi:hypothetical protein